MKVDKECWDCMELDLDEDNQQFICLVACSFNKTEERCPGYVWNEVNDKPWYEYPGGCK